MARLKITLVNNFHNTSCNAIINIDNKGYFRFTESQNRRIEKTLCGLSDCQCGTIRGTCFETDNNKSFKWDIVTQDGLCIRQPNIY